MTLALYLSSAHLNRLRLIVAVSFGLLAARGAAQVVWDNGNGNNQWGTGNNWSTNAVPTAASNVQFNATDDNATVSDISLGANRSANSLIFNNVDDSFSLTNGSGTRTLTLTSGDITRTAGSSGTQTLAFSTLALGGDAALSISGAGSLVIASAVIDSGGSRALVKSGSGELVLAGANTYTGLTTINAGILTVSNASALGTTAGGTTVSSGGQLSLSGGITLAGEALTLNGSGTSGALVNAAGSNTWNGNVTLAAASTIANTAAGTTLTVGGFGSNRSLTNAGFALTVDGPGNLLFNAQTGGSGGLIKNGTGTTTLSYGDSNNATLSVYSGTTQVNNGTLIVDIGGNNGTPATPLNGAITVGAADGSGTSLMELRYIQQVGDSTTVRVNQTGTFRLTAATYTTDLAETIGALTLEGGARVESVSGANSATFILNGDVTRVATGNTSAIIEGNLNLGAGTRSFTVADSTAIVDLGISALVSGAAGLTKSGAGTLELTGNNTYAGGTTLAAGTLAAGHDNALGTGNLTITAGTITATGGPRTLANGVSVGGNFAIGGTEALTFTGPIDLGGATRTITVNNTATTTFAGSVTEPFYSGLTKAGSGELVLSGNNSFTAPVTVSAGTLTLAHSGALGSSTYGNTIASGATLALTNGITVNEGQFSITGTGVAGVGAIHNASGSNTLNATLDLGGNATINTAAGSLTASGSVSLGGNRLTLTGAGPTTLSGDIYGSGGLTKTDTGTLTLSGAGANSFSGTLAINEGTVALAKTAGTNAVGGGAVNIGDGAGAAGSAVLRLDASNQIADYSGVITVNADGVLQLNNFTENINTLAGTGLIDLATSGYLGVGVNSGSSTFSGSLTGSGTFAKLGSGTLTLTDNVDFSGTFELAGGTLSLSSLTLSAGTLFVSANSIIDFGGAASVLDFDNLTIAAGVTLTIQNWTNATDFFYAQNWTGAAFNTGGSNPMNQVVFSGFNANDTKWQSYDRQVTPVPEPSTYGALLVGGLAAFAALRRRSRRSRRG